jgi:hypothetical protein
VNGEAQQPTEVHFRLLPREPLTSLTSPQ